MRPLLFTSLVLPIALTSACATTSPMDSDGGPPVDAQLAADAGPPIDAAPRIDGGADAGAAPDAGPPPGCIAGWHEVTTVALAGGVRPVFTLTSVAARADGSAALTYEVTPLDGSGVTTTLVWLDTTGTPVHTEIVPRGARVLREGRGIAAILGEELVTLEPRGRGASQAMVPVGLDVEQVGDAICGFRAPAGSTSGTALQAACAVHDATGWSVTPMGGVFSVYDAPRVAFGQSASASRPDRAIVMLDGSYHGGGTAAVDLVTLDADGTTHETIVSFREVVIADAEYDARTDGFDLLLGDDVDPAPDGFAFRPVLRHLDAVGADSLGPAIDPSVETVPGWGLAGSLAHGPASLAAAYASASTNQNLQLDVIAAGSARHERDAEVVGNGDRPLLAANDHGYVLASIARASVPSEPDRLVFRCDVAE